MEAKESVLANYTSGASSGSPHQEPSVYDSSTD